MTQKKVDTSQNTCYEKDMVTIPKREYDELKKIASYIGSAIKGFQRKLQAMEKE